MTGLKKGGGEGENADVESFLIAGGEMESAISAIFLTVFLFPVLASAMTRHYKFNVNVSYALSAL